MKAFVLLPGGGQAVYGPSGLLYYRHVDWLGSSRLASTATRTVYSTVEYGPFGEPYAQTGTTDLSFTGKTQDTAPGGLTGLYDFWFRRYGPQGRWISPDPAGLAATDLANPQSWNRYAYVGNDPLSYVDPLGLFKRCWKVRREGRDGDITWETECRDDGNWVPGDFEGERSGPGAGPAKPSTSRIPPSSASCELAMSKCVRKADEDLDRCLWWGGVGYGLAFGIAETGCAFTGGGLRACATGVAYVGELSIGVVVGGCFGGFKSDLDKCEQERTQCYTSGK